MTGHSPDPRAIGVLGALAVLIMLYSLLIVQQFLLGAILVASLFVVYLFWRFVRSLERIAGALETISERRATE